MSEETLTILGHEVAYDSAIYDGVRYLSRLDPQEAKVFFDEAYNKGSALFEDHMGTKFKLILSNGAYQLVRA
jgi:hypothetical protein